MKENKTEWKKEYDKIELNDQILDLNKKCPENLIDDLKMEYITPYLRNNMVVLELGGGSGRLITRIGLEKQQMQLIGIDYFDHAAQLIKTNFDILNLNGTSVCANAFYIPIKSNSIDVIVSGGLLEHFNKREIGDILKEVYRVLKHDGFLYSDIVPNRFSLCRPIILKHYGGYENSFRVSHWINFFNSAGFTNVNIFRSAVLPPNFYEWFRSGMKLKAMYKLQPYINKLDQTIVSDCFGFMYYVFARKA